MPAFNITEVFFFLHEFSEFTFTPLHSCIEGKKLFQALYELVQLCLCSKGVNVPSIRAGVNNCKI